MIGVKTTEKSIITLHQKQNEDRSKQSDDYSFISTLEKDVKIQDG